MGLNLQIHAVHTGMRTLKTWANKPQILKIAPIQSQVPMSPWHLRLLPDFEHPTLHTAQQNLPLLSVANGAHHKPWTHWRGEKTSAYYLLYLYYSHIYSILSCSNSCHLVFLVTLFCLYFPQITCPSNSVGNAAISYSLCFSISKLPDTLCLQQLLWLVIDLITSLQQHRGAKQIYSYVNDEAKYWRWPSNSIQFHSDWLES